MRKLCLGFSFAAMVIFAACGDDNGSSAGDLDELSSSSAVDSNKSSASDKSSSSSSESADSGASKDSSSSSKEESSSSEEPESSNEEKSSSSISSSFSDASIYNASSNSLTDLRDGQVYRTTTIEINDAERGINYSEVWMAENLNFVTENSLCCGGSGTTEGDCSVYGRLYTWAAAVGKTEGECGFGNECGLGTGDIRGACPKGWHLPSQSEWNELLFTAMGDLSMAGAKLKTATVWKSCYGETDDCSSNGTDNYGFSALPAAIRDIDGRCEKYVEDELTYFWSSTEASEYSALGEYLSYYEDGAFPYTYSDKSYGFSVRCLKD